MLLPLGSKIKLSLRREALVKLKAKFTLDLWLGFRMKIDAWKCSEVKRILTHSILQGATVKLKVHGATAWSLMDEVLITPPATQHPLNWHVVSLYWSRRHYIINGCLEIMMILQISQHLNNDKYCTALMVIPCNDAICIWSEWNLIELLVHSFCLGYWAPLWW